MQARPTPVVGHVLSPRTRLGAVVLFVKELLIEQRDYNIRYGSGTSRIYSKRREY
jgi:hypothetical protein